MGCKNCGYNVPSGSAFCPNCGLKLEDAEKVVDSNEKVVTTPTTVTYQNTQTNSESGAIGWGFLGFFFPLVGLILFIIWMKEKPKSSKAAGIGALIRVVLAIMLFILLFVITFIAASSNSYQSIYY